MEYKASLPGKEHSDIHEFLADVSSFANTVGGVMLFGVKTERDEHGSDTGIPSALAGVGEINAGAVELRLLEILHNGLRPRAVPDPAFQFVEVPGTNGPVLAIGVSRSFAAPHVVWTNKSGKFYRRTSVGKLQADVEEIRRMFLEAEEWAEEARNFCEKRVADAVRGGLGFALSPDVRTFLHILPLGRRTTLVDLPGLKSELITHATALYAPVGCDFRFDVDGFFVAAGPRDAPPPFYVYWLRHGGLECGTDMFRHDVNTEDRAFWLTGLSEWLQGLGELARFIATTLRVEPPLSIHVTLDDMRDRNLSHLVRPAHTRGFRQDRIVLPPVIVMDTRDNLAEILRPMLDVLWQSAGFDGIPPEVMSKAPTAR